MPLPAGIQLLSYSSILGRILTTIPVVQGSCGFIVTFGNRLATFSLGRRNIWDLETDVSIQGHPSSLYLEALL